MSLLRPDTDQLSFFLLCTALLHIISYRKLMNVAGLRLHTHRPMPCYLICHHYTAMTDHFTKIFILIPTKSKAHSTAQCSSQLKASSRLECHLSALQSTNLLFNYAINSLQIYLSLCVQCIVKYKTSFSLLLQ